MNGLYDSIKLTKCFYIWKDKASQYEKLHWSKPLLEISSTCCQQFATDKNVVIDIVICCDVNFSIVSRTYQMMTLRKIGTFCIFGIFGVRGVHHTKKNLGSMFFALKFGTFELFDMSWHVAHLCWYCKILRCCDIQHFQLRSQLLVTSTNDKKKYPCFSHMTLMFDTIGSVIVPPTICSTTVCTSALFNYDDLWHWLEEMGNIIGWQSSVPPPHGNVATNLLQWRHP